MWKVLLVDDELFALQSMLDCVPWGECGITMLQAADGRQALDIIHSTHVDLLVTDIKMPRMDGIQLIKTLREEQNPLPAIVLSCHNEFDLVREAMKMGTSDYLFKPTMLAEDIKESVVKELEKIEEQRRIKQEEGLESGRAEKRNALAARLLQDDTGHDTALGELFADLPQGTPYALQVLVCTRLPARGGGQAGETQLLQDGLAQQLEHTLAPFAASFVLERKWNEWVAIVVVNPAKDGSLQAAARGLLQKAQGQGADLSLGLSALETYPTGLTGLFRQASLAARQGEAVGHGGVFVGAQNTAGATSELLLKAVEYIHASLADKSLTLKTVSEHVGVSKNHFSKIFKENMQVNFIDYITRLRVEKARNLYINTDYKVYEIAEMVGYSDWHYLYLVYKKHLGHSMTKEKRKSSHGAQG